MLFVTGGSAKLRRVRAKFDDPMDEVLESDQDKDLCEEVHQIWMIQREGKFPL